MSFPPRACSSLQPSSAFRPRRVDVQHHPSWRKSSTIHGPAKQESRWSGSKFEAQTQALCTERKTRTSNLESRLCAHHSRTCAHQQTIDSTPSNGIPSRTKKEEREPPKPFTTQHVFSSSERHSVSCACIPQMRVFSIHTLEYSRTHSTGDTVCTKDLSIHTLL